MGILERTRHVVRADLNDLIRKAKNPEAVLEAYLDELESVLAEAESLRAAEAAEREVYEARLRDAKDAQATWEKKARACLKRGDEALARTALERKLDMNAELAELARELDHRQASLDVLDGSLEALRLRIGEVARKRRELRYRRQVLQARSELQRSLGRLGQDSDDPILTEAEEGLAAVESQIEAAESLDAEDTERRLLQLEAKERRQRRRSQVDEALEALREQMSDEES